MPRKIASGKKKQEKREVPKWKLDQVKEVNDWLKGKKVVGIVSLRGLPSSQLQEIKKRLRGKGEVRVYRAIVLRKALEKSKELKQLADRIDGPCGLIASEDNPFRLFRFLKQNQGKRAARPGDKLSTEIVVPAGETDLPAGPALAELKMAKIDVRIDKGKIVVSKDSPVAKQGDVVTQQLASALSKLGIKPMPVGVQLLTVHEGGVFYEPQVLDIDEEAFRNSVVSAARNALNLSVSVGYPTKQNVTLLVGKAHRNAVNLSVNACIPEKETIGLLLSKGTAEAAALAGMLSKKGFMP
ncbi:50S ribosomal protein L10 [Candidatus Micrarchaeota archaeon]|nr:50S ribosomal protein L10 [Candidatus Micrarchaeota archaeon]